MGYDAALAERIRTMLRDENNLSEKKMFGGIAFLLRGRVACGLTSKDLVVRVGPEAYAASLAQEYCRPMDFTGRPMTGWVFVEPVGVENDDALARWVSLGVSYARIVAAQGE